MPGSATSTSSPATGGGWPTSMSASSAACSFRRSATSAAPVLEAGTGVAGATIRGAHLRLPGLGETGPTLEIFQYGTGPEAPGTAINRPGFGHIAFAVPDVAAARETVLAEGGGVVGEVVTTGTSDGRRVTWTYVTDPEGNILELQSWSEPGHRMTMPLPPGSRPGRERRQDFARVEREKPASRPRQSIESAARFARRVRHEEDEMTAGLVAEFQCEAPLERPGRRRYASRPRPELATVRSRPRISASQARRSPWIGSGTSVRQRRDGWSRARNRSRSASCARSRIGSPGRVGSDGEVEPDARRTRRRRLQSTTTRSTRRARIRPILDLRDARSPPPTSR